MSNDNKIVLIGEGGSGKSTFIKRHLTGRFNNIYLPTLGVEVFPLGNYVVWDTSGQDKFG